MEGLSWLPCAAAIISLLAYTSLASAAAVGFSSDCAVPSRFDPIVLNSSLHGHANANDSKWHDDTWAFRRFGPISRLTLYKAWYYDGLWHNPGELKGVQAWHGRYHFTDDTRLLFGAKRPHVPLNCTLYRSEGIVRAELQYDSIMRFMNFTTNLGRYCAWGFANVTNATSVVVTAPAANTYIAALRGYEGKPLPPSQGGFKKRYIVQLGFAWAKLNCGNDNMTQAALGANATSAALQPSKPVVTAAAPAPPAPTPRARQAGVDFVATSTGPVAARARAAAVAAGAPIAAVRPAVPAAANNLTAGAARPVSPATQATVPAAQ